MTITIMDVVQGEITLYVAASNKGGYDEIPYISYSYIAICLDVYTEVYFF